jgi:hypothetical protein
MFETEATRHRPLKIWSGLIQIYGAAVRDAGNRSPGLYGLGNHTGSYRSMSMTHANPALRRMDERMELDRLPHSSEFKDAA